MFFKIGVVKYFTGKHLCWSFLVKLSALGPATLLKKTPTQVLNEVWEILRTSFFTEHLPWLLMYVRKGS